MENEKKDSQQLSVYSKLCYAIRDNKANVFTAPFIAGTNDEAIRIFGDMCYFGGDNLIARHSDDYVLCRVGSFDIKSGFMTSSGLPTFVISANEIIRVYRERYSKKDLESVDESEDLEVTPSV